MRAQSFHRKNIRLPLGVYRENIACTVTACTENRDPAFRSAELVALSIDALTKASEKHSVFVLAYCFMADHLHLLLLHSTGRNSMVSPMRDFKQVPGYPYKRKTGRPLWQKSYYDHILRSEEGSSRLHDTYSATLLARDLWSARRIIRSAGHWSGIERPSWKAEDLPLRAVICAHRPP